MANSSYAPIRTKIYTSPVNRFPDNVPITVVHMLFFNSMVIYATILLYTSLERVTGFSALPFTSARSSPAAPPRKRSAYSPPISVSSTRLLRAYIPHNDMPCDVIIARKYANLADHARYQTSKAYTGGHYCIEMRL